MTKCQQPDCENLLANRRADARFCSDACKQAAWRAREAARRQARRGATASAVADRDLEPVLRELAAAARGGSAWIKAGGQLRTVTSEELLRLAEMLSRADAK